MDSHLLSIFGFWILTFTAGMVIIPYFIELLVHYKLGKQIRQKATIGSATEFSKLHKYKTGTPTMWWAIILAIIVGMVLWSIILQQLGIINNSLFNQKETYLPLFTLLSIGSLWLIDDYMNIKGIGRTKGLSARVKMLWLTLFAALWAFWFYYKLWWNIVDANGEFLKGINNPFGENFKIGYYFIPLFILVIVATANSVNITDGLDGLAWGLLLFSYSIYTYITYDQWLFLLSTLCMTIVWALVAFLWFNVKPAKFYMWDVWSLSLWATLWILAMLTNTIIILFIIWAIYIFETVSVIIQLTSKRLRNGKKVFRIAPFHHHLEAIWWTEENVVFRLWLIGLIFSVFWIMFYILQK